MKNANCRSQPARWLAQVLEAQSCKTQIVDEMFGVLRSFFADAKQSRNRECALSAAVLENLVLDTPIPTVIAQGNVNVTAVGTVGGTVAGAGGDCQCTGASEPTHFTLSP